MLFLLLAAATTLQAQESPVSKVITLLTDMQQELIAEKAADEKMYEKMACWCKNNGGGKAAAVEIATKRIDQLENQIKSLSSKAAGLETSLSKLAAEMVEDRDALDAATKLRKKDMAEFEGSEKDLIVSIEGLKNALAVLDKHAFLQMPKGAESYLSVKQTVRRILNKGDDVLAEILDSGSRDSLNAFVQDKTSSSGEIIGVLQQMQENFEANLAEMQGDEKKAKEEHAALSAAKKAELAAGEQQSKDKAALLAKTLEAHAAAKEDFKDTSAARDADQAFLGDLNERCATADKDWAERSATRAAEIQAVSETIGILDGDEAHDTFASTLNFVQVRVDVSRLSPRGASLLQALAAAKAGAKLDSFKEVTASINEMIAALKKEQGDEVDHKDFCKKSFQENEMETMDVANLITDLSTRIEELQASVEATGDDIKALKAAIADSRVEQMRASQNRVEENIDFQHTVNDQRATQAVLKKAIDRMSKFYGDKAALVQQEPGAAAPPPPPAMKEYKAHGGAGGVMTMLENIMTDAQELEAEAIAAENDAQKAYESFVKESNHADEKAQRSMANKAEEKAQLESDEVAAQADKADAESRQEQLAKSKADLHKQCDFVLDNFAVRQDARGAEIESLQGAMAALRTA